MKIAMALSCSSVLTSLKIVAKYSVYVNMTPLGAAPKRSLRKAYSERKSLKDLEEQHP